MSQIIPFSEACERNKDPILEVITPYLAKLDSVLEIGSGTAQHALYFAKANPHLSWQTSDQQHYLDGIHAQLDNAPVDNVLPPLQLDVNQAIWLNESLQYGGVYTANTLHIMNDQDVVAFFGGLPAVLAEKAHLMVYGPFKYQGKFTSPSNAAFDESLRSRGEGSCIKDVEVIERLADDAGLKLVLDQTMPAHNQCLVFNK